ncbi:MAG: hypothetical protein HWE07_14020, partial [Cytophagia bacterium]|nr:hypothetical protein [Cytophagia bacterium]
MNGGLFQDFGKQTAKHWTEKLESDLRGKPLESLMWKTSGLEGKPFYTAEDLDFELFNYAHFSQDSSLFGDRFWVNYQPITVDDLSMANQKALSALANGANGVLFRLSSTPNWAVLLKDIQPEYCHLSFELTDDVDSSEFFESYSKYLDTNGTDTSKVSGFASANSRQISSPSHVKTLGFEVKNGINSASSIAIALAEMIEQIDIHTNSGLAIEDCLNKVFLRMIISDDFFLEIAKHRAIRRLFSSLASSYGVQNPRLEIVSQAGPWTSEIDDPHSFMLHATTQAMSAILGGADALLVEPFYNIFPNKPALAERIARNISTIL